MKFMKYKDCFKTNNYLDVFKVDDVKLMGNNKICTKCFSCFNPRKCITALGEFTKLSQTSFQSTPKR